MHPTKALNPLFEAIINSIHGIDEAHIEDGKIIIYVERVKVIEQLEIGDHDRRPVHSFIVEDNGIGFTDDNFESFNTSDTMFKAEKGAKGIGRFLWLKAFQKVAITSVFNRGSEFYKRSFDFMISPKGVENETCGKTEEKARNTTVKLMIYRHGYDTNCPKTLRTIGRKIIEHCLVSFLDPNCPSIILRDDIDTINLNQMFSEEIASQANTTPMKIKGQDFNVLNIRLYEAGEEKHRIHFVAHGREVMTESLSGRIVDLTGKVPDTEDHLFTYSAYITSPFLDERVNQERTGFDLVEGDEVFNSDEEITKQDLINHAIATAKAYLGNFLKAIQEDKKQRTERFINAEAPQFRHLTKYKPDMYDRIPPNLSDDRLRLALSKEDMDLDLELQSRGVELLSKPIKDITNVAEYRKISEDLAAEVSEVSKSKLSQYVVHRKLILSLLENSLKLNSADKYQYESNIHSIIFPMKITSQDIEYAKQNLWIIDERLSYHKYLASDLELNKMEALECDSRKRTDIIVFNASHAFGEGEDPYQSIVIIEFKRPGRDDYTLADNPLDQVINYVSDIRNGKVKTPGGRPVKPSPSTPFFKVLPNV